MRTHTADTREDKHCNMHNTESHSTHTHRHTHTHTHTHTHVLQVNVRDALLRTISFDAPNGKAYRLATDHAPATLLVRWGLARAWSGGQLPPRGRLAHGGVCGPKHPPTRAQCPLPRTTRPQRPRGWHMEEKHFLVDGQPVSASLFDFGLFMVNSAR